MTHPVSNLHAGDTRSHATIIRDAGIGPLVEFLNARGFDDVKASSIHNWSWRDSIPGIYWNALEEGGFATLKELAAYAESKKTGAPTAADAAPTAP